MIISIAARESSQKDGFFIVNIPFVNKEIANTLCIILLEAGGFTIPII